MLIDLDPVLRRIVVSLLPLVSACGHGDCPYQLQPGAPRVIPVPMIAIARKAATWAARLESPAYAVLRMVSGAMFFQHGMQKILGWVTTRAQPEVGSQLWVGGVIELLAGPLVAFGLFTRAASLLAAGTMVVAYVQYHWKLEIAENQWLPVHNRGELAALYCFVFLFIAARGPGAASIDHHLRRPRGPAGG